MSISMIPEFTIITGYRNRDLLRVQSSLDSLSLQTNKDFEFIFIDYGSDPEMAQQIKPLIESYSFATYIFNDTRGWFWNRAHALNTGIKLAKGRVSILWDIDLIVEPDFLKKIGKHNFDIEFTTHRCYYLTEEASLSYFREPRSEQSFKHSYVGLCAVKTERLTGIKGFDEFFQVWGVEDDDLYDRLQKTGLTKRFVSADEIPLYHQWHQTQSMDLPDLWYLQMVEKLFDPNRKKQNSYGEMYKPEDRPALMAYVNKTFRGGIEIEFDLNNKTLIYNSLIKEIMQMSLGEQTYIDFLLPQMEQHKIARKAINSLNLLMKSIGWNFRLINQQQEGKKCVADNIYSFIKYFLGTTKKEIKDYYLDWRKDGFLLILYTSEK